MNSFVNMLLSNNPNMKNNPIVQNALQMAQQNDSQGLKQLAENVCKERGVEINKLIQNLQGMYK